MHKHNRRKTSIPRDSSSIGRHAGKNNLLVAILLLAILVSAGYYAFTHFEGASAYGDDPNYLYLAHSLVLGRYQLSPGYIFSVRLMSFIPIAIIYEFFGITNLTSTLWDIISFLGIIFATFALVRLLYDDKAALISAFVVSIYPMVTKFAVNTGEDPPLVFISLLAILFFLYAERRKSGLYYFASGALLVIDWLIGYEAGLIILFVILYAAIEVVRRRISIDYTSAMFLYGILIPLFIVFIFTYLVTNPHLPFATVSRNLDFYSAVGTRVNGLPTIPTTNNNLMFYPNTFFQYRIFSTLLESPQPFQALLNVSNMIFTPNPSDFGITIYYLAASMFALLVLREKRAYFFIGASLFIIAFLEFGPMSLGLSIRPPAINYVLSYRMQRFMMVAVPFFSAVIGVALSKLLTPQNIYIRSLGVLALAMLLGTLYFNNLATSTYWYYSQYYQESLVMPVANFLRYNPAVNRSALIYLEAMYNNVTVTYTGSNFPSYYGQPASTRIIFSIDNSTNCSVFVPGSYVVWSGPPHCKGWIDIYDMPNVTGIPEQYISQEKPNLPYPPTNIYYVQKQ